MTNTPDGRLEADQGFHAWIWESYSDDASGQRLVAVLLAPEDGRAAVVMHRRADASGPVVLEALMRLATASPPGEARFTRQAVQRAIATIFRFRFHVGFTEAAARGSLADTLLSTYQSALGDPGRYRLGISVPDSDRRRYDRWIRRRVRDHVASWAAAHPGRSWEAEEDDANSRLRIGLDNPDSLATMLDTTPASPDYAHFVGAHFVVVSTLDGTRQAAADPMRLLVVADTGNGYAHIHNGFEPRARTLDFLVAAVDELEFWPNDAEHAAHRAEMDAILHGHPPAGPRGLWTPDMLWYLRQRMDGLLHLTEPQAIATGGDFLAVLSVLRHQGGYLRAAPAIWTYGLGEHELRQGGVGI